MNAPGFVGSKNLGNKLGGEALLDYVIGTEEPAETTPYDINILGDYNIAGELWQIEPLLKKLGIRVLGRITGDARYHDVTVAHRARVSMMVCSQALINVARKLQERYGIPISKAPSTGSPTPPTHCGRWRRCWSRKARRRIWSTAPETLIADQEAQVRAKLAVYRERLSGRKCCFTPAAINPGRSSRRCGTSESR